MNQKSKKKKTDKWVIPPPHPDDTGINAEDIEGCMRQESKRCINSMLRAAAANKKSHTLSNAEEKHLRELYHSKLEYIVTDYFHALAEHGDIPTVDDMEKLDCIDLSGIEPGHPDEAEWEACEAWISSLEHPMYACIPCFTKGILYIDTNNINTFEIISIDMASKTMVFKLGRFSVYTSKDDADNRQYHGFMPSLSGEITVRWTEKDGEYIRETFCPIEKQTTDLDIFTKLSPKQLRWDDIRQQIWQKIYLQTAVTLLDRHKRQGTTPLQHNIAGFLDTIKWVNYMLSSERPVAIRERKTHDEPSVRVKTPDDIPLKRVRTVGTIRFVSAKSPKCPSRKTISQWRLASWPVRGHIRHYKSGKTAYIKPNTFHRKALAGNTTAVHASSAVIRITDNRTNEERSASANG